MSEGEGLMDGDGMGIDPDRGRVKFQMTRDRGKGEWMDPLFWKVASSQGQEHMQRFSIPGGILELSPGH